MAIKTENDVEARADALERVEVFRSTLLDFSKRIADMVDEFEPEGWGLDRPNMTFEDVDSFHMSLQTEMISLETDYEDLKTTVFDLESELSAWSDLEADLDSNDEAEMEAADSNYRRDA